MTNLLLQSLMLLGLLTIPAIVFAVIAHFIEIGIQRRMVTLFGWRSVLWTGWLGTPVHELSHVVLCWVFRHRIDEVRLFDPDLKTGRLGFVRHSFRKGNWFEELGNVLIGTAPLFGGSLVMFVLLWVFYPELAKELITDRQLVEATSWSEVVQRSLGVLARFLRELFQWEHLATVRLWTFLYLTLCVASHMAPSRSDYDGAMRGVWLAVAIAWGVCIAAMAFSGDAFESAIWLFRAMSPVLMLAFLSLMLCGLSWCIVALIFFLRTSWRHA